MSHFLSLSPSTTDYHSNLAFENGINNSFSPSNKNNQINIISNDQAGSKSEIVSRIFADVYSQEGNIDNLIRVMSFHPDFLKEFMTFSNYLMYGQHGALPYDSRHFIAIMASARHNCTYLVKQQEREFLLQNGQKSWLNGLDNIPQKLKDLSEINKLLCHQPWLINQNHIEKILKSQFSWTLTELLMAITILTHFHALSGFVFGCGINENYMQQLDMQEKKSAQEKQERDEEELRRRRRMEQADLEMKLNKNQSDEEFSDDNEDFSYQYEDELDEHLNHNRTSRLNNRNANLNSDELRARSDSTSASNRTLSNSSASSCELGIDMLLKEMQMIKAEDSKSSKDSLISGHKISSSKSSSSLFISKPSGSLSSSSASFSSLTASATGTHSPILILSTSSSNSHAHTNSYLTDLSNTKINKNCNQYQRHCYLHDNNNNTISSSLNSNLVAVVVAKSNDENQDDSNQFQLIDDCESDIEIDPRNNSISNHLKQSLKKTKFSSLNKNHLNSNFFHQKSNSKLTSIKHNINNNKAKHAPVNINSNLISSKKKQAIDIQNIFKKSKTYLLKYQHDPDFTYSDFEQADQSLRLEYYTWENQGYCTALSLYPDICELLDKNFKIAVHMTYNTMGTLTDVDTSLFRRAVWHYIHSLFGVRYDDYDYNQIRILLKSPLRKYIKILCSCPERITKSHYDSIMKEFTHSEKVHVNIVIMEARIQASMLYFLRAINSYFG